MSSSKSFLLTHFHAFSQENSSAIIAFLASALIRFYYSITQSDGIDFSPLLRSTFCCFCARLGMFLSPIREKRGINVCFVRGRKLISRAPSVWGGGKVRRGKAKDHRNAIKSQTRLYIHSSLCAVAHDTYNFIFILINHHYGGGESEAKRETATARWAEWKGKKNLKSTPPELASPFRMRRI